MIYLHTIGPASVEIGTTRIPPANHQVFSALVYLTVERGKPIPRRTLLEMFFPDSREDTGGHSLRQLVYRLRKTGAGLAGDSSTIWLPVDAANWDVEMLLVRGEATAGEIEALGSGYLSDFTPIRSAAFDRWLDDHKAQTTSKLRQVLVRQMNVVRGQRQFSTLHQVARACLALDPLNEEATLATAESLVMAGAKVEALRVLDAYIEEIAPRGADLRVAPKLLRKRISDFITEPEREPVEMVGREKELASLVALLGQSSVGATRGGIITGPSGIGKTRLLEEVCKLAALSGHSVVRAHIHHNDSLRPLALLRDLGPALLELPGAIGASASALATMRGLCGRGPSVYKDAPTGAYETQALVAKIHSDVIEVVDAVADEQPLVICVEDGQWMDEGSLQLLAEMMDDQRPITLLIASRHPLAFPRHVLDSPALVSVALAPLNNSQSRLLLERMLSQARQPHERAFIETAISTAAGIPLYLGTLVHNYQATGDPYGLPLTLSASLAARLGELAEPSLGVFDAVVVLGAYCTARRLEVVTELPRYLLLQGLRGLEERGFLRITDDLICPTHDLLAREAHRRMSPAVSQMLHRATAKCLDADRIDPHAVAFHWEACNECERAVAVLASAADDYLRLGRPREGISVLLEARRLTRTEEERRDIDVSLLFMYRAAGEDSNGVAVARRLGLYSTPSDPALSIIALGFLTGAGEALTPFESQLESIAGNLDLDEGTRANAARLLVMLAEDLASEPSARRALDLIRDIDNPAPPALGTRLIYETVFGSREAAVALADQLYRAANETLSPSERVKYISNAGMAMWRCGDGSRALFFCEAAYGVAKHAKVWSACKGFASLIADMHWTLGDRDAAKRWHSIAFEHHQQSGADRGLYYIGVGILMALADKDPGAARLLLDEASRLYSRVQEHRMALDALAYRVRIDLATGKLPSENDLQELVEGHLARRGNGMGDMIADTVVMALQMTGNLDQAGRLRREYLAIRKDRFPLAPSYLSLRCPMEG